MRTRLFALSLLAATALAMPASVAVAQQDTAQCATVTVSRATEADIPALLADAACYARAMVSAANSQKLRLDKAAELTRPKPAPMPSPSPSPSPSPTPAPTPTHDHTPPPVAGWVPSPSIEGAPGLVASFPVSQGLKPSWGTGAIPKLYGGGEGAFRFTCGAEGQLRYDDPLVLWNQFGKAHLHLFWGPTTVDAATTMATLGAMVGNSTCNYGQYTLNRSSYWAPALLDDAGMVRNADWIAVYYKRPMASSPRCTQGSATFQGACVGLPNQIRYVFGWDQFKPDAPVQGASWYCTGTGSTHYKDLDAVFGAGCKAGDTLVADMAAPNCWDGKFLDAPDHRSHTAYASYGQTGTLRCPATHPYVIPQNESKIAWTVTADMYDAATKRSRLRLASDAMKAGAKPGETLHSDYMEQWVAEAKQMWLDGCIDKGLDCSGGDLGNGLQLIGASQPSYGWTAPTARRSAPQRPAA